MSAEDTSLVIVDTTVWVDYLAGRKTVQTVWLDEHLDIEEIGVISLILSEVLQGFRNDRDFHVGQQELLRFVYFDRYSATMAAAAAQNYRTLRRQGITIRKTIDCMIATFCIENGFRLLHNDRDFEPFEKYLGLKVIRPKLQ